MNDMHPEGALREWSDSAPYWQKHANTISQMFRSLTRALVQDAGIRQGHSVLDVAGGPGEPALTIAEIVGSSGSVICTDAISEMLEAGRSEAHRRRLTNIEFRQCLAEQLPFSDDSFNVVVSRFGVMFFSDVLAALREMLRVTKPSGTVSLTVWHKSELNPFSYLVTNVLSRHFPPQPLAPGGHDAFRFAERGVLASLLEEAGAVSIREHIVEFRIQAPISIEQFWVMRSETSGTLRVKLARLAPEDQARVAQQVQESVREFFPNKQMNFPAQAIVVTGTKPEAEKS